MITYFFTNEELTILLECARVALRDADSFDNIANDLDISDNELKKIQKKLVKYMG
jgi:DNA-binding IscR family transcriptional regulator